MKKLLLTFLVVLLAFTAQAQDEPKKLFFGGVNYDETAVVSVGFAFPIAGSLYEFTYTNIGEYGSLSAEIGYMFDLGGFYVAPLAGPNVDWIENEEEQPMMAYLVGSSGIVIGADLSEKFGLWGYGKYKFAFEDEVMYQDGYVLGAGLFVRF